VAIRVVDGDLLEQPVEVIVNAWNRNTIPWWLLLPQGVSGAIKRRAGIEPFVEVAKFGRLRLGQAVQTSAGRLPFKAIIHVAGINDAWRATERSIRDSVVNSLELAQSKGYASLALPLIGASSGGFNPAESERLILETLGSIKPNLEVLVVRYAGKLGTASTKRT
jgi:O-acetyl-ADP-ribose deacetylase (regulator of RNase III)